MESSVSVLTPQMPVAPIALPNANGNVRLPHEFATGAITSNRLKPILLAAVTAISIASAIAFGVYRLMPPSPPESNEIPAPVVAIQVSPESAVLDGSACTVTDRTEVQHALRGTPTVDAILEATTFAASPARPGHNVPAVAPDDLPDGQPADQEVAKAAGDVVRELVACINTGDFARVDALYSDDSFRRAYGHLDEGHETSEATPEVESPDEPRSVPEILDVHVLGDGRVGVLLAQDVNGYGLQEYLILVRQEDRWLIDEQVKVAQPNSSSQEPPASASVVIQLTDLAFNPDRITVPANTPVELRLVNAGLARHAFVIEGLDIDIYLAPGEEESVTFSSAAGEYEYFSDIPGQRAAGMEGTLIIELMNLPASPEAN